jgi:hypothetical protein
VRQFGGRTIDEHIKGAVEECQRRNAANAEMPPT